MCWSAIPLADSTFGFMRTDSARKPQASCWWIPPMSSKARQPNRGRGLPESLRPAIAKVAESLFDLGLARLIDNGAGSPSGHVDPHDWAILHSVEFQARAFEGTMWEGLGRDQSVAQVRAIRSLGSIPLVVLTAAATLPPPGSEMAALWPAHMRDRVYGTQARLATLSTRGRQIILGHSGHDIPFEAPEAVINAVRSLL